MDDLQYACRYCGDSLITAASHIVSKSFHGRSGRAFLCNYASNYVLGPAHSKILATGQHVVREMHCQACRAYLGWFYVAAERPDQAYKVGSMVIERSYIQPVGAADSDNSESSSSSQED